MSSKKLILEETEDSVIEFEEISKVILKVLDLAITNSKLSEKEVDFILHSIQKTTELKNSEMELLLEIYAGIKNANLTDLIYGNLSIEDIIILVIDKAKEEKEENIRNDNKK